MLTNFNGNYFGYQEHSCKWLFLVWNRLTLRVGMNGKLATGLEWDGKITYISLNFGKGLKERVVRPHQKSRGVFPSPSLGETIYV